MAEEMEVDALPAASEGFDIENMTPVVVPEPLPIPTCGSDENGRLVISHITNVNFKSYAGTTILGPFQKVSECASPSSSIDLDKLLVRALS